MSTSHKISALHFISTLRVNLENENLTDQEFRDFIRNTLPIVDLFNYELNCKELVEIQTALRQAQRDFESAWNKVPLLTPSALGTHERDDCYGQ